ncbi:CLEC16A/TT9, N-terminal [Sesbania bispinosa]|nr:CLEC16A/TT9, N-terminal [Sesbania bispinosa]
MLRSFWRSVDRFSVQHFKHVISELQQIKVVHKHNREFVMDLLQSIVEIVTYGDRQDPLIFECFMEHQVMAEFICILKISEYSKIEGPLLQYLSIMIQNMDSEHSIYYCFSNNYINSIISHPYKFDGGDLAPYYVSFLRAISSKINKDTLCLLVKVRGDAVVSFPLYTEALRFAHHEEKMIQTAIRALILNIYNVSDDMVYQFISTPPVSEYFSDLVHRLRDLCFHLDAFLYDKGKMDTEKRRNGLILQSDKIVDELYFFKDILSVGKLHLSRLVTENLLNGLVFPVLFSLLASKDNNGSDLSAITSLYIVSRLLQVVGGRNIINNVAGVILYQFLKINVRVLSEGNASDGHDVKPFLKCLNEVERIICYAPESNGAENINGNYLGAQWEDFMSGSNISNSNSKAIWDWGCDGQNYDHIVALKHIKRIGFRIYMTSYDQSRVRILKELHGIWFDHIPDTLRIEWASCKRVLEQSSQYKDPLFMLELVLHQQSMNGETSSYFAWQRMVDTIKAFILHFQLKTFIFKGVLVEKPFFNTIASSTNDSGASRASDVSSANFGSNVSLVSGMPCGIAFSNSEIRDIYVIPVACGMIGKLLLAEKHPFRSRQGIVIAIAPLAGLRPKIDEDHPSWLHLRIREFDPQFYTIKTRGNHLSMPDHLTDGRWTLGFPDARACEEARLAILNEITKQRSAVEYVLAPLLHNDLGLAES